MYGRKIENWFKYHAPSREQVSRYTVLREVAKNFAEVINEECPDSCEKDLAMDKLREAVMWANAAIACNEEGS